MATTKAFELGDLGINLTVDSSGNIQSLDIDTDTVDEGSSNLYFTTARARAAISVSGDLTYDSGTGALGFTIPTTIASLSNHDTDALAEGTGNLYFTSARARASMVGGTGIDYNSSTGNIALAASGVTAQSYGSASEVPVITVDAYGRITSASTTSVAGVSTFTFTDATGVLNISTADGGSYDATIGLASFDTTDLAEGTNLYYTQARFDSALAAKSTTDLAEGTNLYYTDARARAAISTDATLSYSAGEISMPATGVTAGSYGSSTQIPSITVDAQGRVTALSNNSITVGDATITISGGTDLETGGDFTTNQGTNETITLNHSAVTRTNTTSSQTATHSGTVTVVDSVTSSATGHITGVNTKTVTLPAGAVPNNATITIAGGTDLETGGDFTVDQAANETITLNHSNVTRTNTTSSASPAHSGTFTVVDGVTTSATGHITGVNTKTVTLPAQYVETDTLDSVTTRGNTTTNNITVNDINVNGNAVIEGDLTVNGTTTTIDATNLAISDNFVYLNDGNGSTTNVDLGWAGGYNDGTYAHAGIFRDASDGRFKAFDSYTPEPDAAVDIDTTHASFALADFQAGTFYGALSGNVTGNLTGTASNADTLDGLNSTQFLRSDASDTFTGSQLDLPTITAWTVSTNDLAHQRADARDDATNYSRLHWYGKSDSGVTSNFRHAWYDGTDYVNVDVSAGGVDFSGSANHMTIGGNTVFHDGYHPNADKWTTARTLSLTGDVTGSTSWDGSGNASITATVGDNSHNHTSVSSSFSITSGQLIGGIGASTTSGTTDWNHSTNARSGSGYTLLLGSHTNGPGGSGYYHPFTFEYNSKDGSGNMNQFAIPYSGTDGPYFRTRYSGTWSGWSELWHSNNDGSGSGLDADTVDGLQASQFLRSDASDQIAVGGRTLDFILADTPTTGNVGAQLRAGSGDYLGLAAGGGTGVGIVIDTNNNVGIGTTSPTSKLHVNGSAYVSDDLLVQDSAEFERGSNPIRIGDGFGTGGSATIHKVNQALYLQYNNGTASGTNAEVRIGGGGTIADLNMIGGGRIYMNRDGVAGDAIEIDHVENSDWSFVFKSSSVGNDNPSGFWVNSDGTPDMRLRSTGGTVTALIHSNGSSYLNGGNVGIGTTSPTQKLHVAGNVTATAYYGDGSNLTGIVAGQRYTEATSAPSSPNLGDEWYDTADGILYKYMQNAWVQQSPAAGIGIYDVNGTKLN